MWRERVGVKDEFGEVVVNGRSLRLGEEVGRELVGVALDQDNLVVLDEVVDEVELRVDVSGLRWDCGSLGKVDGWEVIVVDGSGLELGKADGREVVPVTHDDFGNGGEAHVFGVSGGKGGDGLW